MKVANITLPTPEMYGFCEGVEAAHRFLWNVTEQAKELGISPVYGYHDIVHNDDVRRWHEENGARFVKDLNEVPEGSVVMGSAHGNGPEVEYDIVSRGGYYFDAACPLVIHTHRAVKKARKMGEKVLYIVKGNPDKTDRSKVHDEVAGTMGHMDYYLNEQGELINDPLDRSYVELKDDPNEIIERLISISEKYRIVSQTTLLASVMLDFRDRLGKAILSQQPNAVIHRMNMKDVCRAVDKRQEGVRILLKNKPDRLVVITSEESGNGMGYVDLGRQIVNASGMNTSVDHVDSVLGLEMLGISEQERVAVTASASTPDEITRSVVEGLGGDATKVPAVRPSFSLRGSSIDEIRQSLVAWKKANGTN